MIVLLSGPFQRRPARPVRGARGRRPDPGVDADELVVAQQALRLFDRMLVLLVVAAPLLVAAIWLSRNRRGTILQLTVGTVLLLVLVRRVVLRFQETIVAMRPDQVGGVMAIRPAFEAWLALNPLENPDAPPTPFSMNECVTPSRLMRMRRRPPRTYGHSRRGTPTTVI